VVTGGGDAADTEEDAGVALDETDAAEGVPDELQPATVSMATVAAVIDTTVRNNNDGWRAI
jgi:hypothetical protein